MVDHPDELYVDATTLRQRFNAPGLFEQMQRGELAPQVDHESLAGPASGQPPGTKSQRVLYKRGDVLTAVVHQYMLPDGSIGASGLPDPKWLRDGDRILKYAPSP